MTLNKAAHMRDTPEHWRSTNQMQKSVSVIRQSLTSVYITTANPGCAIHGRDSTAMRGRFPGCSRQRAGDLGYVALSAATATTTAGGETRSQRHSCCLKPDTHTRAGQPHILTSSPARPTDSILTRPRRARNAGRRADIRGPCRQPPLPILHPHKPGVRLQPK